MLQDQDLIEKNARPAGPGPYPPMDGRPGGGDANGVVTRLWGIPTGKSNTSVGCSRRPFSVLAFSPMELASQSAWPHRLATCGHLMALMKSTLAVADRSFVRPASRARLVAVRGPAGSRRDLMTAPCSERERRRSRPQRICVWSPVPPSPALDFHPSGQFLVISAHAQRVLLSNAGRESASTFAPALAARNPLFFFFSPSPSNVPLTKRSSLGAAYAPKATSNLDSSALLQCLGFSDRSPRPPFA